MLFSKLFYLKIIYLLIPFALVTGPALPDILLILFSIIFFLTIFKNENKNYFMYENWMVASIILWIWFIFISFFSINFYTSISEALIFIRYILFIVFSYLVFSNLNKKILLLFLYLIFFLCILVSLDTLFQFYNYSYSYGFGKDLFGRIPEGLYGRLSGPFIDLVPGSFLSRLIFFNILLIYLCYDLFRNNYKIITINIISLSLFFSVIFFSGERMALATTCLGVFLCFLFSKKIRLILLFSMIISILFIFINLKFHPHFNNYEILSSTSKHEGLKIKRKFSCNTGKICEKTFKVQPQFFEVLKNFKESAYGEIYLTSYQMWKDNMFLGIGLNNFKELCYNEKKYKKYHQNFGCTTHPHNIYLQSLLETGLIGFIIFCSFVFLIFSKVNSIKLIDLKIILFSSLLTVFWPIMSTGSFLKNWNMVFICFLCSLCLICTNLINQKKF